MANAAVTASAKGVAAKHGQARAKDNYELEANSRLNNSFLVFCFFEDLHKIQEFLRDLWQKVAYGETSSIAASLTTDIAMNLVYKNEQEVRYLLPGFNIADGDLHRELMLQVLPTITASAPRLKDGTISIQHSLQVYEKAYELGYYSTFRNLCDFRALLLRRIIEFHHGESTQTTVSTQTDQPVPDPVTDIKDQHEKAFLSKQDEGGVSIAF